MARRIVKLAEYPKREKFVGPAGTLMALQRTLMPGSYEKRLSRFTDFDLLGPRTAEPTHGNLYEPLAENRGMHGGWRDKRIRADRFNMALGAGLAATAGLVGFGIYLFNKGKARA